MADKILFSLVARRIVAMEALRSQFKNLEDTIGSLHRLTLTAPRDAEWDEVRDVVGCLDSIRAV